MTKAIEKKAAPAPLAAWEQEAMQEAKADVAKFAQGTPRISFKGSQVTIDGQKAGTEIVVAVIATVFGKAYFPKGYDPKTPQTPECYGFHPDDPKQIKPHEAVAKPVSAACIGCEFNKFGTALRGKGKRCKDEIRLMVAAPTDDYSGAEVRQASIPPSSLRNWSQYVQRLDAMNANYRTVLTKITVEPGDEGGFILQFSPAGKLTEEAYRALRSRKESAVVAAMQPYPDLEAAEEVVEAPKKPRKKLD